MRMPIIFALVSILGNNVHGQTYPDMRYTAHSILSSAAKSGASSLGYSTDTWNTPGTAKVELLSYETLLAKDKSNIDDLAAVSLDDEDTWDCYVNHFEDYDWSELEEWGIAESMETLGWTESMWDDGSGEAVTEDMDWSELSASQKDAAEFICFFQETWDMESIMAWGVSATTPSCFSGNNLVNTKDRGQVRMENLQIGDAVRTSIVKKDAYTRVYSISHLDKNAKIFYKQIYNTGSKVPLEISPDHLMYVNDRLVRADAVKVGDRIHDGHVVSFVKTTFVKGLYAPLTEAGTLLVSGALASSFVAMTDAVPLEFQHTGSHLALFPIRFLCRIDFDFCIYQTYTGSHSDFVSVGIKALDALATMPHAVQVVAAILSTPVLVAFFLAERMLVLTLVVAVMYLRQRSRRKYKSL